MKRMRNEEDGPFFGVQRVFWRRGGLTCAQHGWGVIRGNTAASVFEPFWEGCARVLELENGSGAHHRREAAYEDTTNQCFFAPGILSISQLVRVTVEALEKEDKVKDDNVWL